MKPIIAAIVTTLAATATPTFAAATQGDASPGILVKLFLAFGALIIVMQLVPGVMLFASMVKGLFSALAERKTVANDGK